MDQSPPAMEPQAANPPPAGMSLVGRLMNVLVAPGEVFDQVKAATATVSNWFTPAALFVLVGWIGAALVFSQPALQHQMNDVAEKNIEKQIQKQHLSGQQADQARQTGVKFAGLFTKAAAMAGPVFAGLLIPIWWGLIVWLLGAKLFKANFSFLKAVEVAGLANMIGVLGAVIRVLLVMVTGNVFASPSLALLVKDFDPQNPTDNSMAAANVMTLWFLGVVGIGLSRVSGVSIAKAGGWVFGVWAGYTAVLLGFGFAMQALFAK